MKSFIKLTTAALALVTLASCSNDDLFGNSNSIAGEKTLQLNVEQMGGTSTTRTAYDASNQRIWQEGDVFKAYDGELYKYDYYEYKKASNAFEIQKGTDKDLDDPQYVLFPADKVMTTAWNKADKSVTAYMTLDAEYDYADVAGENGTEYISNLPLWGTAAADATYGVSADVYFMTGILKISLDNVPDNATSIEVTATEDIAGTKNKQLNGMFVALLDKVNVKNVYLKSNDAATDANSKITVNLTEAGKKDTHSVIFLPIPAGHYGQLNVSVKKGATEVYTKKYVDKDIERSKVYAGAKKSFEAAAVNVNKLNTLLATFANSATGDAELEVSTQTAVGEDAEVGNTVVVPAMKATSLTLNLNKMNGTSSETLTFSGAYAGNFILNIPETDTNISNIAINMPNANVTIASQLKSFTGGINLTDAKSVTFAGYDVDGTETAKNYSTHTIDIKAEVGDITIGSKATVGAISLAADHRTENLTVEGTAGAITIEAAAAHPCDVNVSGTAGTITNKDAGAITLSGVAASITNYGTGDITINGAPNYAAATYAKVGNVTTKGNVTVALDNEGAAISGNLTLVDGKKLTLTQGYVKNVIGPTEDIKKATVELGTEAKYIALATTENNVEVTGTTKWNGEMIGGSIDTDAKAEAIKEGLKSTRTNVITAWQAYKDAPTAVYTAIGLAENAGVFALKNDIDLNNKPWTPAAATAAINGGGKTIKNLTVAVPESATGMTQVKADAGLGLFSSLGTDANVSNLTLDGVTVNAVVVNDKAATPSYFTVNNIGALAGKTSAEVTLTAVTVKNINLLSAGQAKSLNGAKAIGGVIGLAGAKVTMTGVVVEGGSIKGYSEMGGLIGNAGANEIKIQMKDKDADPKTAADVKTSVSGVTFAANHNSASTDAANDKNYLKVGNFIGTATGAGAITISDVTVAAALDMESIIKAAYTGYTHYYVEPTFYPYVFGQGLIGYCGDVALENASSINGKTYNMYTTEATGTAKDLDGSATKPFALYYIKK